MNIYEAIKSGKPFRRPSSHNNEARQWNSIESCVGAHLHWADITSDDWEVEEETITVTRSRVEKAIQSNLRITPIDPLSAGSFGQRYTIEGIGQVCKALGFSEK